jgi:hypothetical protein
MSRTAACMTSTHGAAACKQQVACTQGQAHSMGFPLPCCHEQLCTPAKQSTCSCLNAEDSDICCCSSDICLHGSSSGHCLLLGSKELTHLSLHEISQAATANSSRTLMAASNYTVPNYTGCLTKPVAHKTATCSLQETARNTMQPAVSEP